MSGPGDDDSSWDDPPKPLSNGSGGARGKLEELKLVPRTPPRNQGTTSQGSVSHGGASAGRSGTPALGTPALASPNRSNTMIGLGAVKPPGGPLPSPLQGLSSAMARTPVARDAGGEASTARSTPARPASTALGSPAPPAFADGAATIVDVTRPAPPPPGSPVPETVESAVLEEEDEDGLSKAYLAPTSVPKAMLPSTEDDAKVVINLPTPATPSNEEVTATIDREALERQKVRDEQLDAQRRREPTQRIPRKAVEEARREIEERQARLVTREAALEMGEDPADVVVDSIRAIPSAPISNPPAASVRGLDDEPAASTRPTSASSRGSSSRPAPRALDATVTESHLQAENDTASDDEPAPAPPRGASGRSTTWIAVAAIVAAGAAGLFFMLRTPVEGKTPEGATTTTTTQAPAKTATRPTGEPTAPPLQLTAEPKTDTPDPNAVHLDQQAADTPSPTPQPTTQPVTPVAQPRLPPVKPVNTYYTPTDI